LATLVAMQPYFLPYAGYFALVSRAEHFVILDADQYVKRRWMNRSLIEINREKKWLTLPVKHAEQKSSINSIELANNSSSFEKALKTFRVLTKKSPLFMDSDLECALSSTSNLCDLNVSLIELVFDRMDLPKPKMHYMSELRLGHYTDFQTRAVEFCDLLGCETYLNASGGRNLYDDVNFQSRGIKLEFMPNFIVNEEDELSVLSYKSNIAKLRKRIMEGAK
jgi:hypothetical protein